MSQPRILRAAVVAFCGVVFALGLEGCRESEQGRVIFQKKGEYAGKPDQRLTDAQVDALRLRAAGRQL